MHLLEPKDVQWSWAFFSAWNQEINWGHFWAHFILLVSLWHLLMALYLVKNGCYTTILSHNLRLIKIFICISKFQGEGQ